MRALTLAKNLRRRDDDTHGRHAGLRPQQLFCYFCCPECIVCISASMLMAVACEFVPYWWRTGETHVRGIFMCFTQQFCGFTTVISWCAFLPHFPILFRCSSAEPSLHNMRTPQDYLLQFLATTTCCRSQNPTVDPVFVHFRPFASSL